MDVKVKFGPGFNLDPDLPVPCPVCGVTTRHRNQQLYWCLECDHVFQHPLKRTAVYDLQYIKQRYDTYSTTPLISHLRLGLLMSYGQRGRLLDVGYGNGDFVHTASRAGFEAFGNDVHGGGEFYGVKEVSLDGGLQWDYLTFFDSLEHFEGLEEIRELGKRAKWIIVSTPKRPIRFPDIFDLSWKHYRPGEHLHYFSVGSLNKLFRDHDLVNVCDVEDVIRNRLPDGSANILTCVFERR